MKIELMIYVYIAICISMILYNIVYVFILRYRQKALVTNSEKFEKVITDEMKKIKSGGEVSQKHKDILCKVLDITPGITAFDKALERIYKEDTKLAERYFVETFSVFEYLTRRYINKDTIKIAYFPYILCKYNILRCFESEKLTPILFDLLRSVNVYCRENTVKAIYSMQKPQLVVDSLKIIDKLPTFHHPKLVCDGLLDFKGDKKELTDRLIGCFESFSDGMKVNILNYFRFGNVKCHDHMLKILKNENENNELRYSAIRYFEKFPSEDARGTIQNLADNIEGRTWEYQAIASSALKSYKDEITFRILIKNLSNSNWYIRQNSAVSCERLGYTYYDLINVFDGNDRYAREMMRYYLDKRNVEKEVAKS